MRRAVPVVLAGVLALLAALAGCGVPTGSDAASVPPDQVPFGLLDEDREPVAGEEPDSRVGIGIHLYYADQERLVPVERSVDAASVDAAIDQLEREPNEMEVALGLTSALADIDAVDGTEREDALVTVDLASGFADISGTDQLVALAQVVFTVTDLPGITRVAFTLDGEPVEILTGSGILTSTPVGRADYRQLAPGT